MPERRRLAPALFKGGVARRAGRVYVIVIVGGNVKSFVSVKRG